MFVSAVRGLVGPRNKGLNDDVDPGQDVGFSAEVLASPTTTVNSKMGTTRIKH